MGVFLRSTKKTRMYAGDTHGIFTHKEGNKAEFIRKADGYMKNDSTITGEVYKEINRNTCRTSKQVHNCDQTVHKARQEHTLYSTDLAASDYYSFSKLKTHLRAQLNI